jgi:hypothetical protein
LYDHHQIQGQKAGESTPKELEEIFQSGSGVLRFENFRPFSVPHEGPAVLFVVCQGFFFPFILSLRGWKKYNRIL